jgi:uncharacterized protein (DUF427 family)
MVTVASPAPYVFTEPATLVEPTPRRIRVRLADHLVADSTRAHLLVQYGPEGFPTYYLPMSDVSPGVLVDAVPGKGEQQVFSVQAGRARAQGAAWSHTDPTGDFAVLADHVTFSWRQVQFYEEDEPVFVHARDPYKRIDTLRSSRRVEVFVGGERVARSVRPLLLVETGLPVRYYLPAEDVRTDLLVASDTVSSCPYKGRARYYSIRAGGTTVADAVWTYPEPIPENPRIRDLLAFFAERVDLVVDGVPQPRPVTPWSDPDPRVEDAVHR